MEDIRLTKDLFPYLTQLCKEKGVKLHRIIKDLGLSHQLMYQWREKTPKTLLTVDIILEKLYSLPDKQVHQHYWGRLVEVPNGLYSATCISCKGHIGCGKKHIDNKYTLMAENELLLKREN